MKRLAGLLAFSVGLLSLSQEIMWVRLAGFGQQGKPQAFALVLTAFLLGIALGAVVGRNLCQRSPDLLRSAGWVLVQSALTDLACAFIAYRVVGDTPDKMVVLALLIGLTALLKGILFPIVHHLGTEPGGDGLVGRSVSRVYVANVLGASLGPLLTGYWLLDVVGVEAALAGVAGGTALLAMLCLGYGAPRWHAAVPLGVFACAAYAAVFPSPMIATLATLQAEGLAVRHVLQNKHGILHVLAGEDGQGDITFGGGAYDGVISTDMAANRNGLDRAYLMAVMHAAPRQVLVIGMSTGAWVRAILGMPSIERVDVVEINPGYLDLIRRYPSMAPMLDDPRLHVHVDDGRRWLRQQGGARFDLIFQNTTYHWRAYSTLLLSRDYFELARQHLAPGGIFAVNTTSSADVYQTALAAFPHAVRYKNFVYMSEQPLTKRADALQVLRDCRIGNTPAFADELFGQKRIGDSLAHDPLQTASAYLLETGGSPTVITDLNLLPEFRHGQPPLGGLLAPWLPHP